VDYQVGQQCMCSLLRQCMCSLLQFVATCCSVRVRVLLPHGGVLQCVAFICNVL